MGEYAKIAFDCEKYKNKQKQAILENCEQNKCDVLYMELGGKIVNDFHSSRVLPGYRPDLKIELINEIFPDAEFICGISAKDILGNRYRGDFDIKYGEEIFRLIDELKNKGKAVKKIIITRISKDNINQPVIEFEKIAKAKGFEIFKFFEIDNYEPSDKIIKGLEETPFIKSDAKQVIVIAPGANSGKFRICLSQIYHEMKNGRMPQYIKMETHPVHNLPENHLLNKAYEASTADIGDKNTLDNSGSVSYNRDIKNFELLKFVASLFDEKVSRCIRNYDSPTSMGINHLKEGIINDRLVQRESAAEIARRLARYYQEYLDGKESKETVLCIKQLVGSICEV